MQILLRNLNIHYQVTINTVTSKQTGIKSEALEMALEYPGSLSAQSPVGRSKNKIAVCMCEKLSVACSLSDLTQG
jgi:hypothetical protein